MDNGLKVKISDSYTNQFITTVRGFTIKKGEVKVLQHSQLQSDSEIQHELNDGRLVIVRDIDEHAELKKQIREELKEELTKEIKQELSKKEEYNKIIEDVPLKGIKEVVSKNNNPREQLKLKEEKEKPEEGKQKEDVI